MRKITKALSAGLLCGLSGSSALACLDYFHSQEWAEWLKTSDAASNAAHPTFAASSSRSTPGANAAVTAWKLNLTSATGTSFNPTINSFINQTSADVQQVWYDATFVYVKHTGVPSHTTGRTDNNNPGYASNLNRTSRIPRVPTEATTHTSTGLGGIGVMVNGALFFNASDAHSYNNLNIWHQNANIVEGGTFDVGPGHCAPGQGQMPGPTTPGTYHYHQGPAALLEQIDPANTGQHHSPLLGFAFDGFPIYGPYGYSDPNNAASAPKRIASSYQLRDDLLSTGLRHSLTDGGAALPTAQWGPSISAQYPAGYYLEDYEYVAGNGDLNQYNARFTITPEYPQGTWAYFMTRDDNGATYPYIAGPQYFGVLDTANIGPTGGMVAIPGGSSQLKVGDANVDGAVDLLDFNALASGFGRYGLWQNGDFNRDGSVNLIDFNLLAANFGLSAMGAGGPTPQDWASLTAAGPEPCGACAAIVTISQLARPVRRARRAVRR